MRRISYAKWSAAHPDYHREWRAQNPDKVRSRNEARRARITGAPGWHTEAQALARIAYYGGRCWMCGAEATLLDHVKALCNGGSNWSANLRPACEKCNQRKGAYERHHQLTPEDIVIHFKHTDFKDAR